jgi:hypothetical protein
MRDVGDQLRRHLGRRQHEVDQPGGDRAARHPIVLGGFGVLRHHHAALALDRPQPQRTIASRARQHDADRPLVLVLGQGSKEEVDRQPQASRCGRFQQLQGTIQKGHVPVGRNDVGTVRLNRHPVLDLEDLHPRVAFDQIRKHALVVRGQVLHQDKSHAAVGIGGHARKEGFERRQSPGRRADADNGKTRLRADVQAPLRGWLGRERGLHRHVTLSVFRRRVLLTHAIPPFRVNLILPSRTAGSSCKHTFRWE